MADNTLKFRATMDDKVSGPLDKIRGKFDTLGKSKGFKSVALGVGIGAGAAAFSVLGQAAGMAGDFIGDSIGKASDLNETISKSQVIFGNSAKDIENWAGTASRSFGQSKTDALDAASTFAGLFDTVGIEMDKATPMAKKLTELGSDLASFFNTDVTQALDAVRSGLAGESEPLRRFNIFLSEAAVKAKATQMGLIGAHGELTEGQKILARYQIILDQTTSAQGDFARTADGLANSQRTSSAVLEDSQAMLGQKFLPIAKQVTDWQIDFIEGIDVAAKGIGDLAGGVEDLGIKLSDTVDEGDLQNRSMARFDKLVTEIQPNLMEFRKGEVEAGHAATKMAYDAERGAARVVVSFDDMLAALKRDTGDLIDEVYDPAIQHAALAADKQEYADLRRVLSSSKSTAAEKRDARDRMLSLTKDADQTRLSLLESGNLTASETATWLAKLRKKYASETGAAKDKVGELIAKVEELARLKALGINISVDLETRKRDNKTGNSPRAHGGPVWPGEAYTVGEHGQETLVMGNRGGTIIPNGAGASVMVNFNSTFPISPAQARVVVPELVREMRRQHVL